MRRRSEVQGATEPAGKPLSEVFANEPQTLLQEPGATTFDEAVAKREERMRERERAATLDVPDPAKRSIDRALAEQRAFEGATLTVTAGREGYSPIAFHTFEVGPLSLTVTVRPGESVAAAHARGVAILDDLMATHFEKALARHLDRLSKARGAAQARGFDTSRK